MTTIKTPAAAPRVAFLAVEQASGQVGGAEALHQGFCSALSGLGWSVDKVRVEVDESTFDGVLESYLRVYDLDLSRYDLVISSKAPSYAVRHPRHICYLMHTVRVFYDMYDQEYPTPWEGLERQRERILQLDTGLLAPGRVGRILTIGDEVTRRLAQFNGLPSEVLYPGLLRDHFHEGRFENYLFVPGRLHRWKRVGLLIDAMRYVDADVELRIGGSGEDEDALRAKAQDDPRIRFLGRLSDAECIEQYANALAVPFPPIREDFGYVTLEAFRSGKPVITCSDSGTPADLVARTGGGIVSEPEARALARAIEELAGNREGCREIGARGRLATMDITWDAAAARIAAVAEELFGLKAS